MPSVGLPGVRGAVPRAVPGLLRLFAPRESMEDNPFDEAIVDEDLFALRAGRGLTLYRTG